MCSETVISFSYRPSCCFIFITIIIVIPYYYHYDGCYLFGLVFCAGFLNRIQAQMSGVLSGLPRPGSFGFGGRIPEGGNTTSTTKVRNQPRILHQYSFIATLFHMLLFHWYYIYMVAQEPPLKVPRIIASSLPPLLPAGLLNEPYLTATNCVPASQPDTPESRQPSI